MKQETLSRELVHIAEAMLVRESTGKLGHNKLIRDAYAASLPELGWLAHIIQRAQLRSEIPFNPHIWQACECVQDRAFGKARQSIEMSADHEFVEWLARFRAQHDTPIEISTSTNPIPSIVPPSPATQLPPGKGDQSSIQ